MRETKHLIIGAGFVGLGMAKALKDFNISYDQVEASDELGGNWYNGVYPGVVAISPREITGYTDYPMQKGYSPYPKAEEIFEYLRNFALHFNLKQSIEFNKKVILVNPMTNNLWRVKFQDGEERAYKGVLVCNGHYWDMKFPECPGQFSGHYLHAKQYTNKKIIENKKVLIIGNGNSGCDISVGTVGLASESHISIRNGEWILPKYIFKIPAMEFINPITFTKAKRFLLKIILSFYARKYKQCGLPLPTHSIYDTHPVINSFFLPYIRNKKIKLHHEVRSFENKTVHFVDGSKEKFDVVIAATGYHNSYPFLRDIVEVKGSVPQAPAGTFPPMYRGLYLVGWNRSVYGIGALVASGAKNICRAIQIQDKLKYPIGFIYQELGIEIPKNQIVDAVVLLKSAEKTVAFIDKLPSIEKAISFRLNKRWHATA